MTKFELKRPTNYSNEELLNEIKKVSKLVDKPLTRTKFNLYSKYNASTIEKRFGKWSIALKEAGLDESYLHVDNLKISTEDIIRELIRVSIILESKSFTIKEFTQNSHLSSFVFKGNNSFNRIMKLAGLEIPSKSRKYDDQERFENLLKVWAFYGRQPLLAEMKIAPSEVGPKSYITRWGSWTKALNTFIEKANSDITEKEIKTEITNIENKKQRLEPKDRREIPLGLRYDVLKRDKFCCTICGATPKTHNISLEIDHIIPWSKGGKTIEENLRTLCSKCNKGKSDKIE